MRPFIAIILLLTSVPSVCQGGINNWFPETFLNVARGHFASVPEKGEDELTPSLLEEQESESRETLSLAEREPNERKLKKIKSVNDLPALLHTEESSLLAELSTSSNKPPLASPTTPIYTDTTPSSPLKQPQSPLAYRRGVALKHLSIPQRDNNTQTKIIPFPPHSTNTPPTSTEKTLTHNKSDRKPILERTIYPPLNAPTQGLQKKTKPQTQVAQTTHMMVPLAGRSLFAHLFQIPFKIIFKIFNDVFGQHQGKTNDFANGRG